MDNILAKEIITEYCFGDFQIESIYKFVNPNISDEIEKKSYAEALLTKALQKSANALNTTIGKMIEKSECED